MAAQEQETPSRKVVIDAGAAIKLQRIDRFGGELYSTGAVMAEVRDEKARALLKTLPSEIRVKEPLAEDWARAKQFSKETGDFGSLSQNDMSLIALTIALYREAGELDALRQHPAPPTLGDGGEQGFDWAPAPLAKAENAGEADTGLAEKKSGDTPDAAAQQAAPEASASSAQAPAAKEPEASGDASTGEVATTDTPAVSSADPATTGDNADDDDGWTTIPVKGKPKEEEEDCDSEDGSSAGEWITSENMHRFGLGVELPQECRITCATADYSVQNVLLQMGVTPLTFDGYAVRSVKLWGLICRACCHFTRETQKVFCPKCGHDTLVRVPLQIGKDGKMTVMNTGRKLRTKGTVYSIPKHHGGRAWKPVYAEDEMMIGGRDREFRHKQRIAEKEKMARDPFDEDNGTRAWYQRGTTGTGGRVDATAPRVQAGYGRRNPNANNFKHKSFGNKRR